MYQGKIPVREFIEQFFTFLMPIVDSQGQTRILKWRPEAALKQHFKTYQQQNPEISKACETGNVTAIVHEFLQLYSQDDTSGKLKAIAQWHLAAYLEAPVYQAVRDRFRVYKDYNAPDKTWEHYLHIAKCLASDSDKVAEIYHRYKPDKDSLSQHFRLELASKIRDVFHQETGQGKYSIWYALKRVSDRELKRRLTASGIDEARLPLYLAVKDALFEVYTKSGDRWIEPTAEQYRQATDFYNRHYAGEKIEVDLFRSMLATCVKANQASPTIESLDDEKYKSLPVQENLLLESPLTRLEEEQSSEDFKQRLVQIDRILLEQFQQLEEQDREILRLYGQGLNQTRIATAVGVNQGTVSRRSQRSHRQLLGAIAEWMQSEHQISVATTENLAAYIEFWLSRQYQNEASTQPKGGPGDHENA
jgi:RNA polymerase sigma factor (sigma-70 family)